MAAWVLGEFRDPKAIGPLIESLTDYDVARCYFSAEALAKIGQSAIPALLKALSSPKGETRSWAASAFAKMGPPAIVSLSKYLDGERSIGRYHAVRAIRLIGDRQGVPALIKALESNDRRVVEEAAWGLGEIGDPKAKAPLLKALDNPRNSHASCSALFGIAGALAKFKEGRAFERLAALAEDDNWLVRRAAIQALPAVGGEKSLPILVKLIRHEHKSTRGDAAIALGHLRDPRAVPVLIAALADSELFVRSWAAWSLGEIGDARALSSLRRASESGNKHMNRIATEAIKKIDAAPTRRRNKKEKLSNN